MPCSRLPYAHLTLLIGLVVIQFPLLKTNFLSIKLRQCKLDLTYLQCISNYNEHDYI